MEIESYKSYESNNSICVMHISWAHFNIICSPSIICPPFLCLGRNKYCNVFMVQIQLEGWVQLYDVTMNKTQLIFTIGKNTASC